MERRFDHLADVETFITVVDKGTLSAAAVALVTTPSVISRAIKRLEKKVGVQLLRLTTRRLCLTEAGRLYLDQMRNAFGMIADVENTLQSQREQPGGLLRISAPSTYGHYRLPALLAAFNRHYPQVRIELSICNRNVDLVAENFDLAIRMGALPDSRMIGRKLEDARLCLVAAPLYLQRAGVPRNLADLKSHACLTFVIPGTGRIRPWQLVEDGQSVDWIPTATVQVSEDVLGIVSLAEQGLGICQSYDFIVRERIRQGHLVELLEQSSGRTRSFSMVYPHHRLLSSAARALIDFLTGQDRR
ncbi:LysR family transcriptional regulator [Pseudomonas sp. GM55]|jgi:DNA-binding transcriptional LysR family regulator|uniref:LysR family transcriptional regulator n=1 Tax=Pseudomonas sp. GM55 TaxID=1144333 RepID=UPI0002708F33|nr:LysR family transcriptional regulator [Pseudomonas sp. GM55]EJM75359.1 transcriptional regulator [Pseudomonas sp. GM55]